MNDDASQLSNITASPTYYAGLRLMCGATFRVTVESGEILADIRDDNGRPVSATMTADEAGQIAWILQAAERAC